VAAGTTVGPKWQHDYLPRSESCFAAAPLTMHLLDLNSRFQTSPPCIASLMALRMLWLLMGPQCISRPTEGIFGSFIGRLL
jgi:hypothetical protein